MAQHLETQTHSTEGGDCIAVTLKAKALMGISTVDECAKDLEEVDTSQRVVLNMENVRLVNSRFLALLIRCAKTAGETGGRFVLCNLGREVQKLMDMLHLERLLEVYGSVNEAVEALAANSPGQNAETDGDTN